MQYSRLDLRTGDGVLDLHVFHPDGAGSWPAVVFYMDAFGVRAELFGMAERLASHGYVVALPNLYYRSGAYAPFDPREVAAGGAERDRFKGMIASIGNAPVMADTATILASLEQHPAVRPGPRGVVGYCMGGGFALAAAGTFPDRGGRRGVFSRRLAGDRQAGQRSPAGRSDPGQGLYRGGRRSTRASLTSSGSGSTPRCEPPASITRSRSIRTRVTASR